MTDEERARAARNAKDVRYPKTIEQAIADTLDSMANPDVSVTVTRELMLEMLTLLAKLKHS